YPVIPPKVEYSLSDEGRELQDLIMDLSLWGKKWLEKRGMKTAADEDLDTLKAVFTKQSH
ncbi:winged helix-turn-helix transcriptional regulator, partial [Acinetobacter pittii]